MHCTEPAMVSIERQVHPDGFVAEDVTARLDNPNFLHLLADTSCVPADGLPVGAANCSSDTRVHGIRVGDRNDLKVVSRPTHSTDVCWSFGRNENDTHIPQQQQFRWSLCNTLTVWPC